MTRAEWKRRDQARSEVGRGCAHLGEFLRHFHLAIDASSSAYAEYHLDVAVNHHEEFEAALDCACDIAADVEQAS